MAARVSAVWGWLVAHPGRALLICLVSAAVLRLPFLTVSLQDDEGGFLLVAGQWHGRGDAIYSDQWVDRPPLLLLIFKLAYLLGGDRVTLRLFSLAFGSVTIGAAWWAGGVVNGRRGAVTAAVVAASLTACFLLDGFALTGEIIAGSFVMISCALILEARYGHRSTSVSIACAFAAGFFVSFAFLSKQNFVDGGIFAAVLLALHPRENWRLIVAGIAGSAAPLILTVVWARSSDGPGVSRLWIALVEFRQESLSVIRDASSGPPYHRLESLGMAALVSGIFFLSWQLLIAGRRSQIKKDVHVAAIVMAVYVLVSILVGASWWNHYLLQAVPVLALGTALATRRKRRWLGGHAVASYVAVASVVTVLVEAPMVVPDQAFTETMASYLRAASEPGDSAVLAYGAPNVMQEAGLTTPYEYSWSLPIRTRDPHLHELVGLLEGADAPTWLVEIGDFNWWGLDTSDFRRVREERYQLVATICGHEVYLLDGLTREEPATPSCADAVSASTGVRPPQED